VYIYLGSDTLHVIWCTWFALENWLPLPVWFST